MLYAASSVELPLGHGADLSVEAVELRRLVVRQAFSLPHVRFIGAHTGCSCGFPSVMADEPVEYYAGMLDQADNRAADLRSVRALLDLLRRLAGGGARLELLPVADGEEHRPPKGTIDLRLAEADAERFFLTERFLHRVRA